MLSQPNYQCDLIIVGQHHQPEVQYLRYILEKIKKKSNQSAKFEFKVEFETQFNDLYEELLKRNNDFIDYKGQFPIVYWRDSYKIIGNFSEFLSYLTENFSFIEEKELKDFNEIALTNYKGLLSNGVNQYAKLELNDFLDMSEKDYSLFKNRENRTVVLELFFQICPKTVMNFLEICKESFKNKKGEKLSYKGCEVFRVVTNGYIQAGDLNHLTGGKSIYNGPFEDENFTVKHNTAGLIGSVKNRGKSHSNESQFYITLNPLSFFDEKFVAFGRVIKGFEIVKRIAEVDCYLQRPKKKIEIVSCGMYQG
mmetsp:Transcript_3498/g.3528  ORF Transcript_3498/g.3528 Transcript_3498/m.3528 type:complete len:309 (-) Transcript_3498:66-992(-)